MPRSSHRSVCAIGVFAVVFYLIERTQSSLDGYVPGQDYPTYNEVPQGLSFTCDDKIPGYYADPETSCQVWHWCVPGLSGNTMYSFICAPGTVFNQQTRVCDWFFKVDCPNSPALYGINEDLYKDEAGNFIAGKKPFSYDKRATTHEDWRRKRQNQRLNRSKRRNEQTNTQTDNKNIDHFNKKSVLPLIKRVEK